MSLSTWRLVFLALPVVLVSGQDFNNPALGYCLPDYGIPNLEATQLLFTSPVDLIDTFLETYRVAGTEIELARDELKDFASVTRRYLPENLQRNFNDRSILQAVMFQQAEGPDRNLTMACVEALRSAIEETAPAFNFLMFVGLNFDFTTGPESLDESRRELDDRLAYSWVLQQMEESTVSFNRFIGTMLGAGEAFGVFHYFDSIYLAGIATWEELALSPVSIVSKYASTYLTDGQLLKPGFDDLTISGRPASEHFDSIYNRTIAICS